MTARVPDVASADKAFGTGLRRIALVVDLLRLVGQEAVGEISPLVHPEITVLGTPGLAPGGGYQGREEFLGYFAEAKAHGLFIQPDVSEIRVSPSGAVLATGSLRVAGPSGIDEVPAWFVYTFLGGLIASLATYLDCAQAETAAGL
jgi:hypothetical protein